MASPLQQLLAYLVYMYSLSMINSSTHIEKKLRCLGPVSIVKAHISAAVRETLLGALCSQASLAP